MKLFGIMVEVQVIPSILFQKGMKLFFTIRIKFHSKRDKIIGTNFLIILSKESELIYGRNQ
jgi:hypothetical protein